MKLSTSFVIAVLVLTCAIHKARAAEDTPPPQPPLIHPTPLSPWLLLQRRNNAAAALTAQQRFLQKLNGRGWRSFQRTPPSAVQ